MSPGSTGRVGIAVDGPNRPDGAQLRQHALANVTGVKNQFDAVQRAEQFWPNKPMRIGN